MPIGQSLDVYLSGFPTKYFASRRWGTILRAEFFAGVPSHCIYLQTNFGDFSMTKLLKKVAIAAMLTPFLLGSFAAAQEVAGPADGTVLYVNLSQDRELSGSLVEMADMKVTTSFGEVAIPFSKIDGIKLHADASDASVIAFKNGDLITGKVVLDQVKLKTDWGAAHVNTTQIESVTTTKNAKFFSDMRDGKRKWRFSKAPTSAAQPTSSAPRFSNN
jgi:hypothetical protein